MKHRFMRFFLITMLLSMMLLTACGGGGDTSKASEKADKLVDLTSYYGLGDNEALMIVNGSIKEVHAKLIDGEYFIPASLAAELNSHLYFNETEEIALFTSAKGMTTYYPDALYKLDNGERVDMDSKALRFGSDGQMYASLALTGLEFMTLNDPVRVVIWTDVAGKNFYSINERTALRTSGSEDAEVISYLEAGDYVTVNSAEAGDFVHVVTENGLGGYVLLGELTNVGENADCGATKNAKANADILASLKYTDHKAYGENLLSVWHNMEYSATGELITNELNGSEGVDVIIPTWYSVVGVDGSISSNANLDYVQTAHALGYKVLGLVNDFAPDVKGIEFLSCTNSRNNFVNNIIASAVDNGLDGINVDFEYITPDSGRHYVQLMRELALACRENGLALTVCVYIPDGVNSYYNYEALADVCDYVFVMTYDEHTNVDNVGPVASIDFVRNGVDAALKFIPAERLLMGVPLYTRLWLDDGLGNMSVQVLTHKTELQTIANKGLSLTWQEDMGYNYTEGNYESGFGRMWVEDERSLALKKQVATYNKLAGVSCWCLGYQDASVWEVLK